MVVFDAVHAAAHSLDIPLRFEPGLLLIIRRAVQVIQIDELRDAGEQLFLHLFIAFGIHVANELQLPWSPVSVQYVSSIYINQRKGHVNVNCPWDVHGPDDEFFKAICTENKSVVVERHHNEVKHCAVLHLALPAGGAHIAVLRKHPDAALVLRVVARLC